MEQPKDVEQAQRGGTGPKRWNRGKISNAFQCFKKKMGVTLDVEQVFDVEQPKDVEQAQRCGTGPKINHTFSAEMEQPKEMEQAQRGGTEERSAILGCFYILSS